ncbi:long-chain-fatty-acid--CoA ligase [Paenibacillus humicola]|uniref:long-chain-fatty-acid--CoA ligase n=1 Tax=Paenibacillus humicola TaxID=3110540 RepID=UPI00237AC9E6|nr:long-chain fatty acid--CoA ligase [Paenibacillus humicola]
MEPELARPWLRRYPPEVPPDIGVPDHGVADLLLQAAAKYPDRQALCFYGKETTYRELLDEARRMAGGLQGLGIAKGDRVAVMLPNCPQAVAAYFGVLLAGAVAVMMNPLYVERELIHLLADSGARVAVTLDLLYPRLAKARGDRPDEGPLPQLGTVIVASLKDALPFPKNLLYPLTRRKSGPLPRIPYGKHGVKRLRSFLAGAPPAREEAKPLADDLALLQYTGGTTGLPKGVMLTHRNLVANAAQIAAWCYRLKDGSERFLAALPLFHVYGLTALMNLSVMRAGMLILLPRFEAPAVLDAIRRHRPTVFPGAPTMYIALMNQELDGKIDLSSIEVCVSGSAPLLLEVQERFEALTGGRLVEGYGLTEASPVTHANPIWASRKNGTIGVPLPGTDAGIADPESGERLPPGKIGELVVKGPQVMAGYWNRPEETEAALRDGWLHTGDLAVMDEDGFFAIVDRIKDVIIAGGFNVYPREVEEVLMQHPAVQIAAVIGVKDPYRGETVKAYIVLRQGFSVSRVQLDRWCRDRLAAFKVPHLYEFRSELPLSMIGKVLRRRLKEETAAGDDGADREDG